jgi:hypothetical protein
MDTFQSTFTFLCALRERKLYYLKSKLRLTKVGGYYFPQPFGPRNSHLLFKLPLVDSEFDLKWSLMCSGLYRSDIEVANTTTDTP